MLAGCSALGENPDAAPFHDGDWRSYGNGPANTNRVASGVPEADDYDILTAGGWPYTPPVVHDGVVYFAADRQVVAVTPDGNEQWERRLDSEVSGAPALDPGRRRLYVPTRVVRTTDAPDPAPASVTVLSLADGEVIDTVRVGDRRTYGVTIAEGDVYARSATACVRFGSDGTERWRQPLDPLVYDEYNLGDFTATQVPPAVTADGVYVPDRNSLVKLDPESGEERWRVPVDTARAASVVDGEGVVQTGHQETVAVDHSGAVRWRRDLHSRAGAATAANGDIYVAAGDLHELDPRTGETTWQAHLPSEGTAAPVVTDEHVLVVTGDVRVFRRTTGGLLAPDREHWRMSSVHAVEYSSPVIAAGRTFVVGPAGLIALKPTETD
ncbi:PQQ-binding-like beta-propeller repeat protein [Haloarcula sp. 1CSR25-25]|uniref:outer membrane protein assembly factor BamB family protein n=1 Tax=Haloarcula sp. 1CSR25-25 TaxID=2862545 RepID=UPI0028962A3F|nr:PQQ-binding-like beta-propeller repeat protein [Haloarcula sp. 1CSR25-25]MDT3433928.1 PQQ-binding-like beta-propeller repeat protein [Haloarcula sp. 1CSR25-25]